MDKLYPGVFQGSLQLPNGSCGAFHLVAGILEALKRGDSYIGCVCQFSLAEPQQGTSGTNLLSVNHDFGLCKFCRRYVVLNYHK